MTGGRRLHILYPVLLASAFLLNFCWESWHGLLYRAHQDIPASLYVPMMTQMALLDALAVAGMQLCTALFARDLRWGFSTRNVALFCVAGALPAWAVEYVAVVRLHLWAYTLDMPTLFGVGLAPLLQMPLTGLLSLLLAHAAVGPERR
ncbi:MAG: hypothetical protein HGB02_02140 [Chlorobiaceae bacterium]|nr:hypothetical protein [Chlorobiaceae bacterium]